MIKVSVIGTGGMGYTHGRAYSVMRGVKIVAACDSRKAAVKRFAEEFNVPQTFTSVDDTRTPARWRRPRNEKA